MDRALTHEGTNHRASKVDWTWTLFLQVKRTRPWVTETGWRWSSATLSRAVQLCLQQHVRAVNALER